jgi:hypothetical protein
MRTIRIPAIVLVALLLLAGCSGSPDSYPDFYNPIWQTPSRDASGSMPCGGGDIGLNVWIEDGEILFYIARSGTFDENNTLVKLGRIRLRCEPNPFSGEEFTQELVLEKGYVEIRGQEDGLRGMYRIWVDVHRPVIHAELECNRKVDAELCYESWRFADALLRRDESRENSYKWMPPDSLLKKRDDILFQDQGILFRHRNESPTVFDITVRQQGLEQVKGNMYDPLKDLTYGGLIRGRNFEPAGTRDGKYMDTEFRGWVLRSVEARRAHSVEIYLHTLQAGSNRDWQEGLQKTVREAEEAGRQAFRETVSWWESFWQQSYIIIQPDYAGEESRTGESSTTGGSSPSGENSRTGESNRTGEELSAWKIGRNYQLFRYMLGCNAYGEWPTKFNGGLFTIDPAFTRSEWDFTPDFRNWCGGTFTAQNQRLVYFPMLKSGDFDMMRPQFDFYLRTLHNAELRSRVYWGHEGACYTEQIENFGLPNCTEYGWRRPPGMDPGMQHNAWLEYQWDTVLEFCLMILRLQAYTGQNIAEYIPMIESCLEFFDRHYRYLATERGDDELDADGNLVLYPGSACETYKVALNATSTIAALQQVAKALLMLPDGYLDPERRDRWSRMLRTIPPIPFREIDGRTVIAPAETWERVQNTEVPQLYPVFPWRIYGVGKAGLDTALNTWRYDPDVQKFHDHASWKQYNIFAACLGLSDEAAQETLKKLGDSGRRFPAFWGPGMDWVPDHNWGGSGMIGLQEMLLQVNGEKLLLFPAWPGEWDVHFRLHAPGNTIVEASMKNGRPELLRVQPESRTKDVIIIPDRGNADGKNQ